MREISLILASAQNYILLIIMALFFMGHLSVYANTLPNEILGYYSSNYNESRGKFLVAANNNGGRIISYQNPATGPNGEPLYIDIASFGAKNPKIILVLGSGTHGVEGFAGSAIQAGLLRQGIVSNLGPDIELVMIHAINPYGFSHRRRFNEDNVDLNRNFLDHSKPHPPNKGYGELADALAPQTLSFWNDTKSLIKIMWYRIVHGTGELRSAISGGQYTHPKGLFFGGSKPTWSNKTLRMIANLTLSKAKHIVFIDFHTGLGTHGEAELIMNVKKGSPAFQRAKQWWSDIVTSTVTGDSVSANLQGTLKLAFPEMLPNSTVTAVSLEFGTLSRKEVLWALREENWLYHHGSSEHQEFEKIKNNLVQAFYPDDKEWRQKVWLKGKQIVEKFLHQQ